jgi:hypothetical protein
MQPPSPIACWQCGTVISAAGGRCPACGVEQSNPPNTSGYGTATTTAPRRGRAIEPEKGKSTPWVVLGIGLVAVAALGFFFAPRTSSVEDKPPRAEAAEPPADPSASAPPNELGVRDFASVDPVVALGKARARAIAWHPDAILVSVHAAPVGESGVDLSAGGAIEYVFGRPTGEGFGAGARASNKRFTIKLSKAGESMAESTAAPGRAAIDPNCPFDDVLKKVRASGVPRTTPLVIDYEFSEKHDRTIFRVTSPGDEAVSRALDGQTCAILVR